MPSWSSFQPFIPIGLAAGGVYALSGVGMVVLYRATGVLNLAFGAIGAMGALIAWSMINSWGWPSGVAYAACVLFGGLATLLYGMVFGRLLAARDPLVKAAATLGLALLLLGVMNLLWPAQITRTLALPTDADSFSVGGTLVNATQVIAVGFGIVMTIGTAVFLRVTKLGTAMRALADDREITATLGVPVRRVEAAAWFGSGLIAGGAGLLLADLVTLASDALTFMVIFTLAAALIARLRSLAITFVAAMVIGLVDNLIAPINSITNFRDMTPFVLAVSALLITSRGRQYSFSRGGFAEVGGGMEASGVVTRLGSSLGASARLGRGEAINVVVIAAGILFTLLALPSLLTPYWITISTAAVIYAIVALGLGLLVGRVGLISLGQGAVLALGSWVAAKLLFTTTLPYPIVLLLAGLITMVLGSLIGLPALRVSGLYLALVTLMLAGAITVVLTDTNFPNGGPGFLGYADVSTGTPPLIRRPAIAASDHDYFRYCVVVALIMFMLALWHIRGKPGRAWAAIRQSEPAALAAGVNVTVYKMWAFALGSFVTGVAGGLLASSARILYSYQFPTSGSIVLFAVVLMGGVYTLWGAVVAGILLQVLPGAFTVWGVPNEWATILFGVGVLQVLTTAPAGIAHQLPRDLGKLGRLLYGLVRRLVPAGGRAP